MQYNLYLKSHCEAPDYEDLVIAKSKFEAAKKLQLRANWGNENPIDLETILDNME